MASLPTPMMPDFAGGPVTFLREVRAELAKVTWPTRDEVVKLTFIVIAISFAIGLYIGGLDLVLTSLTNYFLKR